MTTEVGVPGKNIIYLNIHHEGTSANTTCKVNERWTNALLDNQSDYLVAISRFEVPLNRVPITKHLDNAIEIYRYHDSRFRAFDNAYQKDTREEADRQINPQFIPLDKRCTYAEILERNTLAYQQAHPDLVLVPVLEPIDTRENINHYREIEEHLAHEAFDLWDESTNRIGIIDTYLHNVEQIPGQKVGQIDVPPCHTIYEFLNRINKSIKSKLLGGEYKAQRPSTIVAIQDYQNVEKEDALPKIAVDTPAKEDEKEEGHLRYNVYSRELFGQADDDPIAHFKIEMGADYRFSVIMNHHFTRSYYIKLHPELFAMMQFHEKFTDKVNWDRTYLTGRRFIGQRLGGIDRKDPRSLYDAYKQTVPPHDATARNITMKRYLAPAGKDKDPKSYNTAIPAQMAAAGPTMEIGRDGIVVPQLTLMPVEDLCVYYTSPTSAADSFNRIKSIVFTSSLVTKSEGQSGNTYRRILTDFTVPVDSEFSWSPASNQANYGGGTLTEGAAAELTFANNNPSSGRLLIMTDPSPLYELSLTVLAKCWNFDTESFSFEEIPLPQGATFTCKLVFISKNDIYHDHEQRPDKMKG